MTTSPMSIQVENLSKKFCKSLKRSLWYGVQDLAAEVLFRENGRTSLRSDEFWSLRDLSFEVPKGETLGVIGHNGAGKSTLLKMINGLIRPDQGYIRVKGTVGALIDLGLGFSPVLSGRENIYVNAAIIGLSRKEVDRRIDDIIDFAEIGDFIDAPVQSYSSGMKVRLGFSIASSLSPSILLIDEVLAVGDASFRERCNTRLREFKANGGTILFVSHNARAVEAICDRVLRLDHGHLVEIGDPHAILECYEKQARDLGRQATGRLGGHQLDDSDDELVFAAVRCISLSGVEKRTFEFGEPFEIRLEFDVLEGLEHPTFQIWIHKGIDSTPFTMMATDGIDIPVLGGRTSLSCYLCNPSFSPGEYEIEVGVRKYLTSMLGKKWYAPLRVLGGFEITSKRYLERYPCAPRARLSSLAPAVVDHEWKLCSNSANLATEKSRA